MATDVPSDLLRAVWEYPLFDFLYGRRTRRFGLGLEMAQGPYQYRSSKAPVPLCEDEEALLAFGVFYTGSIGAGAVWPALYGLLSDTIDLTTAMLLIATIVLLTLPLARQLRRFLSRRVATIAG